MLRDVALMENLSLSPDQLKGIFSLMASGKLQSLLDLTISAEKENAANVAKRQKTEQLVVAVLVKKWRVRRLTTGRNRFVRIQQRGSELYS